MPPTGPRSRAQPQTRAPPPNSSVRNEVFENIFGRPAVNHHQGSNPPPNPQQQYQSTPLPSQFPVQPQAYGYGGYGALPQSNAGYMNAAQPSFPPAQVGVGYAVAAPPPRGVSSTYGQGGSEASMYAGRPGFETQNGQYGRTPAPQQVYGGGLSAQPDPLPDRRASLAPSTYSTHSTASYYSPQPDSYTPPPPNGRQARIPSNTAPSIRSQHWDAPQQQATPPYPTRLPPIDSAISAAQAYQASQGYGDQVVHSPVSAVFPTRAAAGPSRAAEYRPPPARDGEERMISPPPDYIKAMGNLGFDGVGGGPLDSVAGIPKRGESENRSFRETEDYFGATTSLSSQQQQQQRAPDGRVPSSSSSTTLHRRMASDSSIASSGYTSMTHRQYVAPLSRIEPSPVIGGADSPYDSPSTPTGSDAGFAVTAQRRLSGRKSMESTVSLPLPNPAYDSPLPPGAASSSTSTGIDNRATSFSGSTQNRREAVTTVRSGSVGHNTVRRNPPSAYAFPTPQSSQRSLSGTLTRSTSTARQIAIQNMPTIYPALLSRVAEAFRQIVTLSELIKDGITYKDSFDGRTAVGAIGDIIKTPDRNLALLLGRALDAQKFFHDVTYDHRLRDNPNEVYQFKERLSAPFISDSKVTDSPLSDHGLGRNTSSGSRRPPVVPLHQPSDSGTSVQTSDSQASSIYTTNSSQTHLTHPNSSSPSLINKMAAGGSVPVGLVAEEDDLPVGVFTLLTDCYSPTCSRERLCYSINCPRRLEQMKRLNMKPQPGLSRKLEDESTMDVKETGTLWIHSVSQEVLDSVDDTEKKRQEAINEVMYTERDFVRDLEYLRDSWVKPLRTQEIVELKRREDFVRQVFWNVHDVLTVNHVLAERLTKRQKQQPVVQAIGDLFLERVPHFEPFVAYGAHQLFGKYEFEKERDKNPAFQKFVDETERKPESRRLELNGYLTKPTTRLGRYPLLLSAVLKYTPDDHPDKKDITEAITKIKALLARVNIASGKAENVFELAQLEGQLVFRPSETIDLRLGDKNRELVHKGPLKRRGGNRDEIADLLGFLFDHAFLLVKPKHVNKAEQYRVYRRPIPLELLVIVTPDDHYNSTKLSINTRNKLMTRPSASSSRTGSTSNSTTTHVPPKPESKHGFSITIIHLGKKGYSMQLWVDTHVGRKKWLEAIDQQQVILRERSCIFVMESITEGYFSGMRKVRCLSPYDNGNRMIYGTDEGVYFSNLRDDKLREPVKVIHLLDVTQVDVIEEYQLLVVLHERSVTTFPLECLDPNDPNAALKRGKRISSHTSFFKSGVCLGRLLVAVVKSSTLSSTIKVMEPVERGASGGKGKQTGGFMKRLNGGNEHLKLFKEFYIPTESSSLHFLKTRLCLGCTKGFEIVDLETLDMQGLLDPSDGSLDFVLKRDNVRPIAIYRIEEDFLLCYDEFAFYVNKNGWRARPKWAIIWEGVPTAFALQYPYVIAFEPTFVEVHHVETGHLVQIIPGSNISCLFADTPPSRVNAPGQGVMQGQNGNQGGRQFVFPPGQGQGQGGNGVNGSLRGGGGPNQFGGMPPQGQGQGQGQGGMMRYPQGQGQGQGQGGYGGMPPPPLPPNMPRFSRPQVIFTSDDGHVQFLKFPVVSTGRIGSGIGIGVGVGGSMHVQGHGASR